MGVEKYMIVVVPLPHLFLILILLPLLFLLYILQLLSVSLFKPPFYLLPEVIE